MIKIDDKIDNIPAYDRTVLQCLSIFWEQITQTDLLQLLTILEIETTEGRRHTQKTVSEFRKTYVGMGFLENTQASWGNGFQISTPQLKECFTREAREETWFDSAIFSIQRFFAIDQHSWSLNVGERYKSRLMRDYRINIYQENTDRCEILKREIAERNLDNEANELVYQIFSNPFQSSFLAKFDHLFQIGVVIQCFSEAIRNMESSIGIHEFIDEHKLNNAPVIKGMLAEELVFSGSFDKAMALIGDTRGLSQVTTSATICFLRQDYDTALSLFEESIKTWRELTSKRNGFSANWQMFLFGLALYKSDEALFHKFATKYLTYCQKNYEHFPAAHAINAVSAHLRNNVEEAEASYSEIDTNSLYSRLLQTLTASIIPTVNDAVLANAFLRNVKDLEYEWIEFELEGLLASKNTKQPTTEKRHEELGEKLQVKTVASVIPQLENWERALNSLRLVADTVKPDRKSKGKTNETRLVWLIDFETHSLRPVEQKFSRKQWTKGRNIALKRLFDGQYEKTTEQDMRVVRASLKKQRDHYSYSGTYSYDFAWESALTELVGHPLLFLQKNVRAHVELFAGEPALVIKEAGGFLELSFDTEFSETGVIVEKETGLRYKLIRVSDHHLEIANSLRDNRLRVPIEGRDMLLKAIRPLSKKIAIQSDLEEYFEELPAVEAEKRIHALLTQIGEGFHLEFFVKPFGSIPPYFKPGKGTESAIAEIDGIRTRTKRDLKEECRLLDEIEEASPFLAKFESPNYEWNLNDVEECLTAMTEMEQPRIDGKLVVEWTKGQKLKLLGTINSGNFSVSVRSRNEWFEVDGTAKVNEHLILSIEELRGMLKQSDSNFVELSDGQFVSITESLRRHLQSMDALLDDKNQLHSLRAGVLEEFSEELENFQADKGWKDHLKRLDEVRHFVPVLPKTFEADLRPYQFEGFNWLSRLAKWGVGACLADDMGLGKTLQALAVLVERADSGPAMVVAPVSVCRNWVKEAMRFAPTLRFQIFGEGDREAAVKELGNYDVLITSYNLLQAEETLLTEKHFATVVLDEAQAVKNRNTKRSRAAMKINADFRMVTTGTPIENHLGELWNLFNFINPGLLGSPDYFNEQFAAPIERDNDDVARKTLQKLVKPFILRRRKNQVLDDLPEKTEIVLNVEMSVPERAFYESIRRDAINVITATDGEASNKRFRILAELTKLRLASCHPNLVDKDIPIESSKLDLFGRTVEELLDNKHKALVFSQFVKHLKIVEKLLQEKGISYQYLDGSTPPGKRQERIDDFQRGKGDVFLISLKAGGTGLNLTAADYVIHLDPWWNPAVEDQATDRVHRIGQKRPVTVYRLVATDTVEEKILKLHETKRDLADSLLDGTETSGKLSADDLLALITDS